jgi:hypothetical protein
MPVKTMNKTCITFNSIFLFTFHSQQKIKKMNQSDFDYFAKDIENEVIKFMKNNQNGPKTAYEQYQAFSAAINWNENFIVSLIAFQLIFIFLTIFTRTNVNIQTFLFFFISAAVSFSERINAYCAVNWKLFSTQNYFDKSGVFAGVMFCGPLLLLCLFQLVKFLTNK